MGRRKHSFAATSFGEEGYDEGKKEWNALIQRNNMCTNVLLVLRISDTVKETGRFQTLQLAD